MIRSIAEQRQAVALRLIVLAAALALPLGMAHANDTGPVRIRVGGVPLGSGVPAVGRAPLDTQAEHVADSDFHVPGVLPGHPTAAALWPRVVRVPCDAVQGELRCSGYEISPMRGEYIYLRPVVVTPPPQEPAPPSPRPSQHKKPLG
jgi:hypothetical protein